MAARILKIEKKNFNQVFRMNYYNTGSIIDSEKNT